MNCCQWEGVQCDPHSSHVVEIHLHQFLLRPSAETYIQVISPALFELKHLEYLDLSWNQLTGAIPAGLFKLQKLKHLDLSGNEFEGSMPEGLGSLKELNYLDLSVAGFNGTIPWQIGNLSQLQFLDLSTLQLYLNGYSSYGEILTSSSLGWTQNLLSLKYLSLDGVELNMRSEEWAASISHLHNLQHLHMFHCQLSGGPIPISLLNLTSLSYLDLSLNSFSSTIPPWLGNMSTLLSLHLQSYLSSNQLGGNLSSVSFQNFTRLSSIDLSSNSLGGNISLSLFQQILPSLSALSLSYNHLTVHVSPTWIPPPSQFRYLMLASCNIGPDIPPFISTLYSLNTLDLSQNNLHGNIPPWLADLPDLTELNLSCNSFQGSLPPTFDLSSYNYLDLHNNQLNGSLPMPSVLANWLQILDLSQNQLSGCIPQKIGEFFPSLKFLSLSTNNFSGNIPHSIGNMQFLEVLDLSNNKLSGGKILSSIANCTALTILNLENTGLKGQVPLTMEKLRKLRTLHLGNNELFGNFPLALQNYSKLEILDMGNNNMSGKIPKWITMLSYLRILVLKRNKLEGSIPSQLCLLKSLQILDLSHNKFSGAIPSTLGKLLAITEPHIEIHKLLDTNSGFYYKEEIKATNKQNEMPYVNTVLLLMTCIDLSANQLAGKIPIEIGELKGLHALNISWNYIRGHIPASFGNMEQLESLDVSHNQLDGKIPPEMVSLHSLVFFIVSNNQLFGRIPSEGQFSTFNATFFANNSGLCGFPLDKCGFTNKSNVPPYSPSDSVDEDEKPEITWYWCASVVASFAVGFWGVYGLLFMKRGWRAKLFEGMDAIAISLVDGIIGRR
eukprot:Gb_14304 [translate_table: standard]